MAAARFLSVVLVLLMAGLTLAHAGVPRDPGTHFFDTTLGDYSDDLATARQQGKQGVMLFFEQKDCPFCDFMEHNVFNQPEVQQYFRKHFVILKVDIKSSNEITDFHGHDTTQRKFFRKIARNRDGTPVMAFFDLKGNLAVRFTGMTAGVKEFMWLGQYVVDGAYKKEPFTIYKRKMRAKDGDSY